MGSGLRTGLAAAVAAGLLAACSSGGSAEQPTATSVGGGTGTTRTASGEPVLIGFINQEASPVVSWPEFGHGNAAAVGYINAELGGIGGRPIKVETCVTNGSPESSASCANQMVEKRVVVVRAGIDLGSAASLPILEAAAIPYVGMTPILPSDYTSGNAFAFESGNLGNTVSAVYVAKTLKVRKVSIVHADNAPGLQFAEVFIKQPLIANGVLETDIVLVAEAESAPDFAAAVASANEQGPDAIMVGFVPPTCARIMQAAATVGVTAPMFFTPPCGDPRVLKAGGAGANLAYFASGLLNITSNGDDPDVKIYVEKAADYGPDGIMVDALSTAEAFGAMMNVQRLLDRLGPAHLSGPEVVAALRATRDEPNFMAHPYTCDGKQVPGMASVCNTFVRLYRYQDGAPVDVLGEWMTASTSPGG